MTKISNQDYIQELEKEVEMLHRIKSAFLEYHDEIECEFDSTIKWWSKYLLEYRKEWEEAMEKYTIEFGR